MQHEAWVRSLVSDLLGDCLDCSLLTTRNHRVYRVSTSRGSRILKVGKVEGSGVTAMHVQTARDSLAKERLLLESLSDANLPVPRVELHGLASDTAPWLLMNDCGPSTVAQEAGRAETSAQVDRLYAEMGRTLAAIHRLPMHAAGQIVMDSRSGTLVVRPRDWDSLVNRLRSVAQRAVLRAWLSPGEVSWVFREFPVPATSVRLCHGDFHAVQAVVDGDRLAAVVDWQSAWAGEPLVDLAVAETNLAMYSPADRLGTFQRSYAEASGEVPWLEDRLADARRHLGRCQALMLLEEADRTGHKALRGRVLRFLREG